MSARKRWEYLRVYILNRRLGRGKLDTEDLDTYGADGWELVGFVTDVIDDLHAVFKREIVDE